MKFITGLLNYSNNLHFYLKFERMGHYKYIDTKHIDSIAAGDTEFMTELIDIFLGQIPEFISTMKNALKEQDYTLLAHEAHTAKSSVLTFGMEETGILLKNIQLKAEANELEEIPFMVNDVVLQLEAVVPELRELKSSL